MAKKQDDIEERLDFRAIEGDARAQINIAKLQNEIMWLKEKLVEQETQCQKRDAEQILSIKELEKWRNYCDRLALKWGGILMGVTGLAAAIAMGVDKLKDKLIMVMWP